MSHLSTDGPNRHVGPGASERFTGVDTLDLPDMAAGASRAYALLVAHAWTAASAPEAR